MNAFEGRTFKCGSTVEYSQLHPDPGYPEKPLLLEFAGSDRTGRGHNRSNHVYVLWRFEPDRGWVEIARVLSKCRDWVCHMRAIALRELGPPTPEPEQACKAVAVCVAALDTQLRQLSGPDRLVALNLLHDQVLGRIANSSTLDL